MHHNINYGALGDKVMNENVIIVHRNKFKWQIKIPFIMWGFTIKLDTLKKV